MAGEYAELVRRAQADADGAHRQQVMDQISMIAPFVSGEASQGADMLAAVALAKFYPPPPKASAAGAEGAPAVADQAR
jgi:hypothetical protein